VGATVLDSGALIALERNQRAMWTVLKRAAILSEDVLVPSTVLAQVWRNTPTQARLAAALQFCVIASFDAVAREVGVLCGRTRSSDICDAHVAIVAHEHGDVLYTSDPNDLRKLVVAIPGRRPKILRC
jgi:predicted nucleic acid-binding protein